MSRKPRRTPSLITRTELIAGIGFAVVVVWLAMMAVGMGA